MKKVEELISKYGLELFDAEEFTPGVITYMYRNNDNSIRATVIGEEIKIFSN